MSDKTLIKRAQDGDRAAFESLLEEQYDCIYRFAYRWTMNVSNAEDITQLVCIKLARTLVQFRFEASFTSWLYRLVINTAKDWQKSEGRHSAHEILEPDEKAYLSGTEEQSIYLQQVLTQLETLGEGFKETALLVHAEGFTHAETAKITGVKESTIAWRIHEIRKKLNFFDKQEAAL